MSLNYFSLLYLDEFKDLFYKKKKVMPPKLKYEFVRDFINKEELLISDEYVDSKTKLEIKCKTCNENYTQNFSSYQNGHRHKKCSVSNFSNKKALLIKYNCEIFVKDTLKECIVCKNNFKSSNRKQKICNRECAKKFYKTNTDFLGNAKIYGRAGGL